MRNYLLLPALYLCMLIHPALAQEIFPEKKGDAWGYVTADGAPVIAFMYEEAKDFEEGVAWVKMQSKWGLIDKKGKYVFPCEFEQVEDFYKGYATVKKEGRYGLASISGKMFVPCAYDELLYPYTKKKNYIAVVYVGDVQGMVRSDGKVEMPEVKNSNTSTVVELDYLKLSLKLPDNWRNDGFGGDIDNWEEGGSSVCDCAGIIVDNVPEGDVKMVIYPYLLKNADNPKRMKVWDYSFEQNKAIPEAFVKAKNLSFKRKQGHWMEDGQITNMEVMQYEAVSGKVGYRVYIWNDKKDNGSLSAYGQYIQMLLDGIMPMK